MMISLVSILVADTIISQIYFYWWMEQTIDTDSLDWTAADRFVNFCLTSSICCFVFLANSDSLTFSYPFLIAFPLFFMVSFTASFVFVVVLATFFPKSLFFTCCIFSVVFEPPNIVNRSYSYFTLLDSLTCCLNSLL